MKYFYLLLLSVTISGDLFSAAAGKRMNLISTSTPWEKRLSEGESSLYNMQIDKDLVRGKQKIGISLGQFLRAFATSIALNDAELSRELKAAIKKHITQGEPSEKGIFLDKLLFLLAPLTRDALFAAYKEDAQKLILPENIKYALWPVLVWAIENENLDLLHSILDKYIPKGEERPYGKVVGQREENGKMVDIHLTTSQIGQYWSIRS